MIYTHIPRGPLAEFIERFWITERVGRSHARERVLPSGTVDLVVDLSPGAAPTMLAAGAHASSFVYRAGR